MTVAFKKYQYSSPYTVRVQNGAIKLPVPFTGGDIEYAVVMVDQGDGLTWVNGDTTYVAIPQATGVFDGLLFTEVVRQAPALAWYPVKNYVGVSNNNSTGIVTVIVMFRMLVTIEDYPRDRDRDRDREKPPIDNPVDYRGLKSARGYKT